jgi:hypothetical protein
MLGVAIAFQVALALVTHEKCSLHLGTELFGRCRDCNYIFRALVVGKIFSQVRRTLTVKGAAGIFSRRYGGACGELVTHRAGRSTVVRCVTFVFRVQMATQEHLKRPFIRLCALICEAECTARIHVLVDQSHIHNGVSRSDKLKIRTLHDEAAVPCSQPVRQRLRPVPLSIVKATVARYPRRIAAPSLASALYCGLPMPCSKNARQVPHT